MTFPKDDSGNVQVDFVWGNFAPQPDELRDGAENSFGGGSGDHGWDSTVYLNSSTLDTVITTNIGTPVKTVPVLNFHNALVEGYSNFPGFIADYAGDNDPDLEVVVPEFVGKLIDVATADAEAVGLSLNTEWWTPIITAVTTLGKTATITLDNNYSLKAKMTISGFLSDGTDNMTFLDGVIKSVSEDGLTVVVTAKTNFEADVEWTTTGSSLFANWGGNFNPSIVLWQQNSAGQVVNAGDSVLVGVLVNND